MPCRGALRHRRVAQFIEMPAFVGPRSPAVALLAVGGAIRTPVPGLPDPGPATAWGSLLKLVTESPGRNGQAQDCWQQMTRRSHVCS